MSYPCPYKGDTAEHCIHRHLAKRRVRQWNSPWIKVICRDPDRVARPEKCYNKPFVKGCAGYKTVKELRE